MNDSLETRRFKWILLCFEFLYLFDRYIRHGLQAYSHGIETYACRREVYKAFVPNHKVQQHSFRKVASSRTIIGHK